MNFAKDLSLKSVAKALFPKGNQALLAAGNPLSDLEDGEMGLFDARTGLSVAGTEAGLRDVFLAVGRGAKVGGEAPDIDRSAGQMIQLDSIIAYSARCYTPPQVKIIQLKDIQSACGTQFGIKLPYSNGMSRQTDGYQRKFKYYTVATDPCDGCEDCPSDDGKDLVQKLYDAINSDPDKLYTADRISNADGTTVLDDAAYASYDAVSNGAPQLRITGTVMPIGAVGGINYTYYYPRVWDFSAHPTEGWKVPFTVETIQELSYEEGSWYDLRQLEYDMEGQDGNPGPYRVTEHGTNLNTMHRVAEGEKYIMVWITYNNYAPSGILEHRNPITTLIALPCGNAHATIMAALDAIAAKSGFGALADYVAACDCDVVNTAYDPDDDLVLTDDGGDSGEDGGAGGVA